MREGSLMVNRVDGVILGVGVVILAASVIGVIVYDEQSPQEFTVSWSQSEAMDLEEQTDSGAPGEYTFETNVSQASLARAEFEVQVSANGANVQDDTVDVEVATPEDRSKSCSFTISGGQTSSSGSCTVEVGLNPRPSVTSVQASNVTTANEEAQSQAQATNGTGTWTTTITISGGQEISDPDYSVSLTPTVYTWEPTATQPGPGGRAG